MASSASSVRGWVCHCGRGAVLCKSSTQKNPGRLFWGCSGWPTRDCGFFRWASQGHAEMEQSIDGGCRGYNKGGKKAFGSEEDGVAKVEDSSLLILKLALGSLILGIVIGFVLGRV